MGNGGKCVQTAKERDSETGRLWKGRNVVCFLIIQISEAMQYLCWKVGRRRNAKGRLAKSRKQLWGDLMEIH